MPLREKIADAFERGKKIGEESDKFEFNWFQHFHFSDDPFFSQSLSLEKKQDELLVDRLPEIESIAELIGIAARTKVGIYTTAVVGADGVGKTSVANIVDKLAQENGISGMIFDVEHDQVIRGDIPKIDSVLGPPMGNYRYIILANTQKPERVKSIIREFKQYAKNPIVIILLLSPEHLTHLQRLDRGVIDREIWITPLQTNDIKMIIQKRLDYYNTSKTQHISDSALELIAAQSYGIPKLALEIANESFKVAYRKQLPTVESNEVKIALNRFNYTELKTLNLTTKEEEILHHLLMVRCITPNSLRDALNMSHNIAWKYLERLNSKGLIEKSYSGRSTLFALNQYIAIQLQLKLYQDQGGP